MLSIVWERQLSLNQVNLDAEAKDRFGATPINVILSAYTTSFFNCLLSLYYLAKEVCKGVGR